MRRWRLIAGGTAILGAVALIVPPDRDARAGPAPPSPQAVVISLAPGRAPTSVPDSFLGLSTEYWAIPGLERHGAVLARVIGLLHVDGDAPFVLRIGGDSADHSFYEPSEHAMPRWMLAITPGWLRDARRLLRVTRARVILDLNLITGSPALAARWAAVAKRELGPRLAALEVGNEPDIYDRTYWRAILAGPRPWDEPLPRAISAAVYARDFDRYAATLAEAAPRIPLAGPALANPAAHERWIPALLSRARGRLAMVTVHRYPYSACASPGWSAFPTVRRLLSPAATTGLADHLRAGVDAAHDAGLPFRLTEMNSVTCGGRPGVSDSFATALWASDALFELVRVGVDAAAIHLRVGAINAAFALGPGGLAPRPLLYGLIMFTRTLGPGARLLPLRLRPAPARLKAWAVSSRRGLSLLLIDKGRRPVRARLALAPDAHAVVERLSAPGPSALAGVSLAGQRLGPGGTWVGRPISERLTPRRRGELLVVPGWSEALVRLSGW